VFYVDESGSGRCLMNGEYMEQLTFAFYDGVTNERLLSMNEFVIEIELRIVPLQDQPTMVTMEDTRRLMDM